ncbi:MAG: hypothetical protein M1830_000425 [Pleopsidium flavum]|nr:MAG: hypothetical protein M1830_000425 [Pleopsidium flavum]
MPRSALPPTPASSTDIPGKNNSRLSLLETSFSLPPPAIAGAETARSSSASTTKSSSESSYHPASPTSPAVDHAIPRRLSSMTQRPSSTANDFSLPPPPTRSRKIIQMKPKPQDQESEVLEPPPMTSKGSAKSKTTQSTAPPSGGNNKKKQPSSTSVAGRKIARKTAHSLIERRRRSKMNEEFGVLKDMIPACKDQEMHKLAILQASIDYLRYLEQCVSNLKANNPHGIPTPTPYSQVPTPTQRQMTSASPEDDEDLEMEDSEPVSADSSEQKYQQQDPVYYSHSNTTSPALDSQRGYSYSSYSTLPSPAFEPQAHYQYIPQSASTSPNLLPQGEDVRNVDHEATTALLMLNTDRRGPSVKGRGMSVKDLLSA